MAIANEQASREDPLVSFHFMIDVQGEIKGYFTEVSGLGSESEVMEHKVVNEKGIEIVKKIPGRLKWGDITLKRGITSNSLTPQGRIYVTGENLRCRFGSFPVTADASSTDISLGRSESRRPQLPFSASQEKLGSLPSVISGKRKSKLRPSRTMTVARFVSARALTEADGAGGAG